MHLSQPITKIFLLAILIFLSGCATKKNTYQFKDHQKFDSINYQSHKTVFPALRDTVYIENPCDSLGNLKPFKQEYITSRGKVSIEGRNGRIEAKIDLKETSTTEVVKDKVSKESNLDVKQSEVVRYKTDWKLWLVLIMSLGLNIYFIWSRLFKNV